jgi:hypothetical protein
MNSGNLLSQTGVALLATIFSSSAMAWVDLNEWKKPKVFGLSPSADTAFVNTTLQSNRDNKNQPAMNKTNTSVLALYPMLDNLVAGFNFGGSTTEVKNIPTAAGLKNLRSNGSWIELAALYSINDDLSIYVSPGLSFRKSTAEGSDTRESFASLTTYGVWAAQDNIGLGLGLSARKNSRTQTLIPIVGGAWQATPEFRLDGWLPANVHARWKLGNGQAVFARVELAGDSSLSQSIVSDTKTEVQLLGGQFMLGYSIGTLIGFGTGSLRIDPSIGFFKGKLTQTNVESEAKTGTSTQLNPLADLRIAVAF